MFIFHHYSEYNEEANILYIVMEEGSDDFALVLKNLLKEDGKLSTNLIKYYWEAMLKAVGALHKEGKLILRPIMILTIKNRNIDIHVLQEIFI